MNITNYRNGSAYKCHQDYIEALEEERKKIQIFERELPLSLQLVTQVIERCRQQVSGSIASDSFINGQLANDQGYNSSSKQISKNDYPILEQYIPINPTSSATNYDQQNDNDDTQKMQHDDHELFPKSKTKDWLTSTQLSIQTPSDPPPINQVDLLSKNKNTCVDAKTTLTIGVERSISSSADTMDNGGGSDGCDGGKGDQEKGSFIRFNKKERRCWSPELHRRFLRALQQLGGAHVATPKQIKDSMKVDGLTNDEIKSHLQKYRLHTRRSNTPLDNDVHTPHQLLLVGQIWMPTLDQYITKTASSSPDTSNNNNVKTIYAPIASLPPSTSLYKTNQQP